MKYVHVFRGEAAHFVRPNSFQMNLSRVRENDKVYDCHELLRRHHFLGKTHENIDKTNSD